ncbi:MAG: heparan-alpha-glucosaminide N-acetyltransferase domain-containing protein, partial [Promethearchaeota archaeon]
MSTTNEKEFNNDFKIDTSRRIASIDFVKGFAIVWIILAHGAVSWFDSDWIYVYGLVFAFMDVLGPSLFVFLSALSVVFSYKRKKGKMSEKAIRNGILTRGAVIIIIGVLFNPMSLMTSGVAVPFPANLWGWNILMFIGFSQIISYYAIKLNRITRAV